MNKIVIFVCFMAIVGITFADIKQWNNFKQRFGKNKKYNDPVQDKMRYALFKKNLNLINACNQDKNSTTRCGVTYTSDWSVTEMKSQIMVNKPKINYTSVNETRTVRGITSQCYKTSIDGSRVCFYKRDPNVKLPESFDVEEYFTRPIQNQNKEQGCGCCWSMSATDSISLSVKYQLSRPTNKPAKPMPATPYSSQELIDCNNKGNNKGKNKGCNGGDQGEAMEYVRKYSISTEEKYPYIASRPGYIQGECKNHQFDKNPNQFKKMEYVHVEENPEAVKQALIEFGTCTISIEAAVPGKFNSLSGKVVYDGKGLNGGMECGDELNHAVTAVGYMKLNGKDVFIVRNSWGDAEWGHKGRFYILPNICGVLKEVRCPVFKN